MELRGIGYLGLGVPDVDAWASFATSVIGLMPARTLQREGVALFKADERQWRVALHPAENGGLLYVGFETGSQSDFDAACRHLASVGVAVAQATDAELGERGVQAMVHFTDPIGVRIEVYWGPTLDGGFASPVGVPHFVGGPLGFGHFVLLVPDLAASMDFYQRVLGFKVSDFVLVGPDMSIQFLRCTPRHHTVAIGSFGPFSALHHVAFEVPDIDQVGYALERATKAGHTITASLGRHKNDRMLSFYMRSPAGFEVEIGCGGRLVDDATWVVNHFTDGDEWGHHGLTAEAMTESVSQ